MIIQLMTKLITFSVSLTKSGSVQTDMEYINYKDFEDIMNSWNPEYEVTPAISYMIRNVVRDLVGINDVMRSYLR